MSEKTGGLKVIGAAQSRKRAWGQSRKFILALRPEIEKLLSQGFTVMEIYLQFQSEIGVQYPSFLRMLNNQIRHKTPRPKTSEQGKASVVPAPVGHNAPSAHGAEQAPKFSQTLLPPAPPEQPEAGVEYHPPGSPEWKKAHGTLDTTAKKPAFVARIPDARKLITGED